MFTIELLLVTLVLLVASVFLAMWRRWKWRGVRAEMRTSRVEMSTSNVEEMSQYVAMAGQARSNADAQHQQENHAPMHHGSVSSCQPHDGSASSEHCSSFDGGSHDGGFSAHHE